MPLPSFSDLILLFSTPLHSQANSFFRITLRLPPRYISPFPVQSFLSIETNNKDAAEAAIALKDQQPSWRQLFKERVRSNSPVLVYDFVQRMAQVRRKKSIGQLFPSTVDGLRD